VTGQQCTDKLKRLGFGDHICFLYNCIDNYRDIATNYIIDGLKNNEKVICIIDEYPKELLISDLENRDIDPFEFIDLGQLVITTVRNTYNGEDGLNCDITIEYWKQKFESIKDENFCGVRIMDEMAFAVDGTQKSLDILMEFEMRVNIEFVKHYDNHIYLCIFNKTKFPMYFLEDMVKKHTVVINNEEVIKPNPNYIDTVEQIKEYSEKVSIRNRYFINLNTDDKLTDTKSEKKNKDMEILKHVLSATGDGIWEWNIETDEIYVSEEFFNILDYKGNRNFKNGDDLEKLINPEDINALADIMCKCHKNEIEHFDHEIRFQKTVDEWIWVRLRGVSIEKDKASGKILKMVGVVNNITESKRLKRELDDKIYFEKLRTDFFANLSHEFRTPINVILGSIQLQLLYLKDDQSSKYINKYERSNKRMKQNCYRLLRLVNNIIDITRIDAGFYNIHLENVNIIKLIKDIVLSVGDYIESSGLKVEFNSNIDQVIMACDPEKIERAILNILSNAIKFTGCGGKISVNITRDIDTLIISIKDSGKGIPNDKLNDIFNRFIQVDKSLSRSHEGSGIGLALTKSLIEMQGGRISAKSKLNKGSEFIILLPIKNAKQEISMQEVSVAGEMNVERIHIEFSDIYF